MSSSYKILPARHFAAGVYLSEAQNPISPPLPYTLYTCKLYTYSYVEGGGELNQREGERGNGGEYLLLGWKYHHDWMYARKFAISSLETLKNTGRKVPLRVIFRWRHFALTSLSLIFLLYALSTLSEKVASLQRQETENLKRRFHTYVYPPVTKSQFASNKTFT
jgi:hypothetical protein